MLCYDDAMIMCDRKKKEFFCVPHTVHQHYAEEELCSETICYLLASGPPALKPGVISPFTSKVKQ